ncbi:hypothetical protein Dda_3571 [Drechslerella dactyloides]|uniref:Uncharacterized protein n=1 Tax=Drechslerella dactyloides TaxID=74499 RepID=A0AAD6J0I5_DREDA|nr:hypothetical protein Dda_3571 [Drechslerella dactyloides]
MASYSTQKSAIPPPSPSPYSRLPTPSNSHFGRPNSSRSISTAIYGSSHPSPSRPSLPPQASPYDSFAPQPCPSPSPSKIPGFGLQRANSTVGSSHRRQSSIAEKAKVFERADDGHAHGHPHGHGLTRSHSTVSAAGAGLSRGIGSIRRGTLGGTPSRPASYVDNSNDRDMFSDMKSPTTGLRRPSLASGASSSARHQYDDAEGQASTPVRKSLGLLSEASPAPMQLKEPGRRDTQLMPPPPPPLIRQFSASPTGGVTLDPPVLQATIKPPSPLPQVPAPSPRKGTHIRTQSHGVALSSKSSRAGTSTRPADPRPTSIVGKKVAVPGRPSSTVNAISAARPRAVSHNAAEARRLVTPANDVPLPRGSLTATNGRTVAPPRPTSTRPNEPVASSSASTRRPPPLISRSRPTSSHITIPAAPTSARGSDTESSMRSESVASSTSNASSVRSDMTTRPKQGSLSVGSKTRDPVSPRKSSPVRGHKKNMSMAAKTSRPNFNNYKQEYQPAPPMPKPSTASLMHAAGGHATSAAPTTDTLHAQTRLLQLAMLHSQSFDATAALRTSARTKLHKRFSQVRDKNAAVHRSYRREQELVDLQAMSLVLKKSSGSNLAAANWKNKLSGNPEEAIQLLSEQLSKVLAWFTEEPYEGEYTSMIRVFEEWIALPDGHERKIDGMGSEFGRDILKMRRKMEMALSGLEGWAVLVVEGEKDGSGEDDECAAGLKSSLGRVLAVTVGRLKAGLEELNAIQAIERTVVTASRKDMRKALVEVMEDRRGADLVQQKRELAAWEPVWAMPSA